MPLMKNEELDMRLHSASAAVFVNYYPELVDKHLTGADVAKLLIRDGYSPGSAAVRVSQARTLIRKGATKRALKRIAGMNRADPDTVQKAEKMLDRPLSASVKHAP